MEPGEAEGVHAVQHGKQVRRGFGDAAGFGEGLYSGAVLFPAPRGTGLAFITSVPCVTGSPIEKEVAVGGVIAQGRHVGGSVQG